MDNHYHLIIENSSGRMSDFLKQLNGNYGSFYRKEHGGKGYVFQDRYKSILVQDDSYLLLAIAYVLNNPVRAGITNQFFEYEWSSGSLVFNKKRSKGVDDLIVDIPYIEDLFETKKNFLKTVTSWDNRSLPVIETKVGKIIGDEEFIKKAKEKFDRRSGKESVERKRIDDKYFDPVEKIIMEFEKLHEIKINKIDVTTFAGKKLRGEFLYYLRESGGFKYSEIIKMDFFSDMKIDSLGSLYKRTKERLSKN